MSKPEQPATTRGGEEARARRRERDAARRAAQDQQYVARFAERIRQLYPGCPPGREQVIAAHACQKYSRRVGRSAEAKQLDDDSIRLAVTAHVRHAETDYDRLLGTEYAREVARQEVFGTVSSILARWQSPPAATRHGDQV